MKKLLSYILSSFLEDGTKIKIKEENSNGIINLSVSVPADKIGKVIGKNGRTVQSIKNLLKIKAIKEEKRVDVQILEAEEKMTS